MAEGTVAEGTVAEGTVAEGTVAGGTVAGGTVAGGTVAGGTVKEGAVKEGAVKEGAVIGGGGSSTLSSKLLEAIEEPAVPKIRRERTPLRFCSSAGFSFAKGSLPRTFLVSHY